MELMRKAREALASVAVLGEPFDRLQWKQVDGIFQHLNAVERACLYRRGAAVYEDGRAVHFY